MIPAGPGNCKAVLTSASTSASSSVSESLRPRSFVMSPNQRIVLLVLPLTLAAPVFGQSEPSPVSAPDSLQRIKTKPGFTVELVSSEPSIVDPVAIDFGADGRLWVLEMHDYPLGMDGNGKPGGRVKVLQDTDGDGRYE